MNARRNRQPVPSESLEVRLCLSGGSYFEVDDFSSLGLDTQGAMLGTSAAIGDRFAVMGAPEGMGAATRSGRVVVFEREEAGTPTDLSDDFWRLHAEIQSPVDRPGEAFGAAVAIHGDTIYVGAPGDTVGEDVGRVFTFDLQGDAWVHSQTVVGPMSQASETFGSSLTVDDSYLIVGSPFSEASGVRAGTVDIFEPDTDGWQHSWRLVGAAPANGDGFGSSISLDGDRLAVGEPGDDALAIDSGSVEVFEVNNGAWSRTDVLKTDNPGFRDRLGASVSQDGTVIVAGAPGRTVGGTRDAGSVMTFSHLAGSWGETAVIAPDSPVPAAGFGTAVSLRDGRLLAGAPNDSTGAVFAYRSIADTWLPEVPLDPDGRNGDQFGAAIAQSEHFALVGVPSFDVVAAQTGSGKIYFRGSPDAWQETPDSRLRAASQFGRFEANYDDAGRSVVVTDDFIAVGIPDRDLQRRRNVGQVLVYERDDKGTAEVFDDTWSDVTVLTSPRPGPNDQFGFAIAASGNTIVVGAPGENVGANDTGAAYVFQNINSQWQHTQTLGETASREERFGSSVAISGTTLAIGMPGRSVGEFFNLGAVQVFDLFDETWVAGTRLTPSTDAKVAQFGASIAIENDTIAVGSPLRDQPGVPDSGVVTTFTRSGQVWTPTEVPAPLDQKSRDRFGEAVLLKGGELFVGIPGWDGPGTDVGRVARYVHSGDEWSLHETIHGTADSDHARFGAALASDGASVWIGSPGNATAALFGELAGAYEASQSISGPADFGASIAASGPLVVVGAPSAGGSGIASGVAKLFAEVPPPEVTIGDISAPEDDSELVFFVTRNHPYGNPEVTVSTVEGTAEAGLDFTAVTNQRLQFSNQGAQQQEVRVAIASDELVEGDETFDISLSDAVFADLARDSATATIIDNDTPQFVVTQSGGSTIVNEGQAPDTIALRLTSQPQSPVVLTLSYQTPARFIVDRDSVTFNSENWSEPQAIAIRVQDDETDYGDHQEVITVAVDETQSDSRFAGLAAQEISLAIIDDDTAGFEIVEPDGVTRVSETGTRDTFTVRLTSKPTDDVVVNIVPDSNDEIEVIDGSLTFTADDWDVPQIVEVEGLDDDEVDGTQVIPTRVVVDPDSPADEYRGVNAQNVKVRNLDFELDFGFAPRDLYPTTLGQNGARHVVKSNLFLGSGISAEKSTTTSGREANDGARLTGVVQSGALVNAVFEPSAAGFVSLWIDLNHDGDWNDFGEHILSERVEQAGQIVFPVRLPVAGFSGETYARARFSTRPVPEPYGLAQDGEVEDFVVDFRERPRGIPNDFEVGSDPVALNVLANDQTNSPSVLSEVTDTDKADVSIEGSRLLFDADDNFSGNVNLTYTATGAVQSLTTTRNTRNSEYGRRLAIDGDVAVIGVPGYRSDRGAVDVYRRTRDGWEFQQRLSSETKEPHHRFGDAVAVSGNTIVVGATTAGGGEVSVFELPGNVWRHTATITVDNAVADARFGATLSLDKDSLLVGAPFAKNSLGVNSGVVFEFQRDEGGGWNQSGVIESVDGLDNDQFGSSLYRSREHLVVGAPKVDKRGNASGAVYSFRHNGTEWIQRQRLTPAGKGDHFGFAVTGSGNTIAISAPLDDEFGLNHGAVWLFERNPISGRYSKLEVLYAETPVDRSRFGEGLAMEGSTLLVGSKLEGEPVLMFRREGHDWIQHRAVAGGSSVAISHGMALFGDPTSDVHRVRGGDALFAELNEFSANVLIRVQ